MLASLEFDAALSLPTAEPTKPISFVCVDTRVEVPSVVGLVEGTLRQLQLISQQNGLKDLNQVRKLENEFACGKRIDAGTSQRMLAKVEGYSENDREHEKQRDIQKCLKLAEIH